MDLRELTGRAAERIRSVFSRDNRFFYGQAEGQEAYEAGAPQAPAQGSYPPAQGQPQYQQAPYQQAQYQQPQYQQAQYQQPQYQQAQYQQPAQVHWQGQAVEQTQPYAYQSPQQSQLGQLQQEPQGRNRRAAQHTQEAEGNLVQFPGTVQEAQQMDAYVVNVSNVAGCRQAMTCLRKGQCTLVVMDQLIDKAEVRRYVDMLNGASFALGGTMTRLSLKIGFYLLAPAGMMVYTDPLTASANAPQQAAAQPQQPSYQPQAQPMYQQQQPQNQQQQPQYQQQAQYAQPQAPHVQPQAQYAPPQPAYQQGSYAPPQGADYQQHPYSAQQYAQ